MPHFYINLEKLDFKINKQPKLKKIQNAIQSKINSLSTKEMELIDKYQSKDVDFPRVFYSVSVRPTTYCQEAFYLSQIVSFQQFGQGFL